MAGWADEMNWQYIEQQIDAELDSLFPNGEGRVGAVRVRSALAKIARTSWTTSRGYHLLGLLDTEQALEQVNTRLRTDGRKPISRRRFLAIAKARHERFAVGRHIARGTWLFAPDEIDSLVPGEHGRHLPK
jgi:hypothetical protein